MTDDTNNIRQDISNLSEYLRGLEQVQVSDDESSRVARTKSLAQHYLNSRITRALQVDDVRQRVMEALLSKLDEAGPGMLLKILNQLSDTSNNEFAMILEAMGLKSDGKGGTVNALNLNINTSPNNQLENTEVGPGSMKMMKLFGRLYDSMISDARLAEKNTIDAKATIEEKENS